MSFLISLLFYFDGQIEPEFVDTCNANKSPCYLEILILYLRDFIMDSSFTILFFLCNSLYRASSTQVLLERIAFKAYTALQV